LKEQIMAKWRSSPYVESAPKKSRVARRAERNHQRSNRTSTPLRLEVCEERNLMAISPLVAVIPNEGAVLNLNAPSTLLVAPTELTLRFGEGEVLDPTTFSQAISVIRSGADGALGTGDDVPVTIGYIGMGEQPNDIIVRFAENLPDDLYRLRISSDLKNATGDTFSGPQLVNFDLNLAPQVTSVVPQPIQRNANGSLTQLTNTIHVYFNNDTLNVDSAQNKSFYQLINTNGTLTPLDDTRVNPASVTYANNKATLTFAAGVLETPALWRLRVGNNDPLPLAPQLFSFGDDPTSDADTTLGTDKVLGTLFTNPTGQQSAVVSSSIDPQPFALEFPGSSNEPGHDRLFDGHLLGDADPDDGIKVFEYNFKQNLIGGFFNFIDDVQKDRVREIFSLYSNYAGVQFVETATSGQTIALTDSIYSVIDPTAVVLDSTNNWGISEYGGDLYQAAMQGIGSLFLGLGNTSDLPPLTAMGNNANGGIAGGPIGTAEMILPGGADITHLQHLFRPDVKDIDAYKFNLAQSGTLTLETHAQRRTDITDAWLDSVISLFDSSGNLIARNDDYFGADSYLNLSLDAGEYFVVVTASGNTSFDLNVPDSGIGGKSQGNYDLTMTFNPVESAANNLVDTTGIILDGDYNGDPGGEYNFWFRTATAANTVFVDKAFTGAANTQNGSLAAPYTTLDRALAETAARGATILRVVGNGGADGDITTLGDNLTYNIGTNLLNQPLSDGRTFEVPQGVTVMVDAGATFRLRGATLDVGSSSVGIDRSQSALQILGTPDNQVLFSSWNDTTIGKTNAGELRQNLSRGDWGGLVFRDDSDREQQGIFLNYVNHADLRYGGGQIGDQTYSPIHLITARPAITFNTITDSATAAISGDPDSFEESVFSTTAFVTDYGRVGPQIHGNSLTTNREGIKRENSINALFVRVRTDVTSPLEPLTVSARFDDTDIVHVLTEVLQIAGDVGVAIEQGGIVIPRQAARLALDPGIIFKQFGSRIEVELGANLLIEGTAENPTILTSVFDDRYGRGNSFDTTADGNNSSPDALDGDWSGIYFSAASHGSIDHAVIMFGGGFSAIEGGFARFNVIEIHQGDVRIANSQIQNNADGEDTSTPPAGEQPRVGRLENDATTIFVRGAQAQILNNIVRNNQGSAISADVNSLNHLLVNDRGRSTGFVDVVGNFPTNRGVLVDGNILENNDINGMVVRGGILTGESVWDDTDIVHVVQEEIAVSNFHTYGGLRLESRQGESLVVKLLGANAGFTAGGLPLDLRDRIGGSLYVIGAPGAPVVLTSLRDDTVGAGRKLDGSPQNDTNNDGSATAPAAGDWRSVKLDRYSNDRNVGVLNELEQNFAATGDVNNLPNTAQFLGILSPNEKGGDDNARLGFIVNGQISQTFDPRSPDPGDDRAADVDVYRFQARPGSQVWLDIDRTAMALDAVVELVDANGSVVARSTNSYDEQQAADLVSFYSPLLTGSLDTARIMQQSMYGGRDFMSVNPRDPGMRVVLPGTGTNLQNYYVRVRANSDNLGQLTRGESQGVYQLQVRLREKDEVGGSTVQYSNIRYATNGVEVIGKPENSPLTGESRALGTNRSFATAQELGNLLASNRSAIEVSGNLTTTDQIDWYRFTIDPLVFPALFGQEQVPSNFWPTVFDIDYAGGTGNADLSLAIFDAGGRLLYWNQDGSHDDDAPRPNNGPDTQNLSGGSFTPLDLPAQDPFIGTVALPIQIPTDHPEYPLLQPFYVAVSHSSASPTVLGGAAYRLEPVLDYQRVLTDYVSSNWGTQSKSIDFTPNVFHLGDAIMYVNTNTDLFTVDPLTGKRETDVTGAVGDPATDFLPGAGVDPFYRYGDIAMRADGKLFTLTQALINSENELAENGRYREISTADGSLIYDRDDEIVTYQADPEEPFDDEGKLNLIEFGNGVTFNALAHEESFNKRVVAVGNILGNPFLVPSTRNLLYILASDGKALDRPGLEDPDEARAPTDVYERGSLFTSTTIFAVPATDTTSFNNLGANTDPFYSNPGDVLDGYLFEIEDLDGTRVTFELDAGLDISVSSWGAQTIRDGQSFKLSDGFTTKTFEFNSGPVLLLKDGANLVDGDSFSIIDDTGKILNFVYDNDDKINTGQIPIKFANTDSLLSVVGNTIEAINKSEGTVTASASTGNPFLGRVSLAGDKGVTIGGGVTSLSLFGDANVTLGNVPIQFEETDDFTTLATSILTTTEGQLTKLVRTGFGDRQGSTIIAPAEKSDRLTFLGGFATPADLAGVPAFSLANDINGNPSASGVTFGNIQVPFDASSTEIEMASLLTASINFAQQSIAAFDVIATQFGAQVQMANAAAPALQDVPTPFTILGEGLGGDITGLAFVDDILYAVDDKGSLFIVQDYDLYETDGPGTGPFLEYVQTSRADLAGLQFSGLTRGPQNVEGGRYAEMLFATTLTGEIYAFNTDGELQPIFINGATFVDTEIGGLRGLTFSPIDYNLWHRTAAENDGTVAGSTGNQSWYFGFEDPRLTTTIVNQPGAANFISYTTAPNNYVYGNEAAFGTYDLPGGPYGSLVSNTIDLTDYTAADQPVFYFSYRYDAEADINYDTVRTFVSDDNGGSWTLVASEETLTRDDQWRQSRINLDGFAGEEIRIRFDFSSAGDMQVGDPDFTGEILRGIAGSQIGDGSTFVIDNTTFEFERGFTVTARAGLVVEDGDAVVVNGTTFEFDKNGTVGPNVVAILNSDTAAEVAQKLSLVVAAAGIGVTPLRDGAQVNLQDATTVTLTDLGQTSFTLAGNAGVSGTNIPVPITIAMSSDEVAEAIATAMDTVFVPVADDDPTVAQSVKVDGDLLQIVGHNVTDPGILPWSNELTLDDPTDPAVIGDRFLAQDGNINRRGQDNANRGIYLDNFIVGFASRGEQVSPVAIVPGTDYSTPIAVSIAGKYELEIRSGVRTNPSVTGDQLQDVRDRQATQASMFIPSGADIVEGEVFRITDGNTVVYFEFDSNGSVGSTNRGDGVIIQHIPISYQPNDDAVEIAELLADTINSRAASTTLPKFLVQANVGGGGRVELLNAAAVGLSNNTQFQVAINGIPVEVTSGDALIDLIGLPFAAGDQNRQRDQGYTLIANNTISDSLEYGILVDSPPRDEANLPGPGAARNLLNPNNDNLVPGIAIFNNLLVTGGDGGIRFSGDDTTGVLATETFGRIYNNTIYGGASATGVGILVDENASPTILNNIIVNHAVGVQVTNNANGTVVLGSNLYQGNTVNRGAGVTETFNIDLAAGQALFVDAANRNFYLAEGSKAIDSSRDSLQDRASLVSVYGGNNSSTNLLGIPPSPILAPEFDLLGQKRIDDPTITSPPGPPGQGLNVFKDRGAIDRADFTGSTVSLVNPLDNDSAGKDKNPAVTQVLLDGERLTNISFRFDDAGTGIDPASVLLENFTFLRSVNGGAPTAVSASEFIFSFDATTSTARFQAAAGIFSPGVYTVQLDNDADGVRDIAGNLLLPNQNDGTTLFTINLASVSLAPWQNPGNYPFANLDVNNSGAVTPGDALALIDELNRNGIRVLPLPKPAGDPFYDVNGDGVISPSDLALVIDHLNRVAAGLLSSVEVSAASSQTATASMVEFGDPTSAQVVPVAASVGSGSADIAWGLSLKSSNVQVAVIDQQGNLWVETPATASSEQSATNAADVVWSQLGDSFSPFDDNELAGDLSSSDRDAMEDDLWHAELDSLDNLFA
jgi:hypothetical protein